MTACDGVETVRLDAPDDLVYPVAFLHTFEEGGGPLYLAETPAELEAIQVFQRPGDQLFLVEVETRFDPGACDSYVGEVYCNSSCFDPRRAFGIDTTNTLIELSSDEEIEGAFSCNPDSLPSCDTCSG